MKKNLFKTLICLTILILTSCNTNGSKNNQNVGYNVPKLDSFEITFHYYSAEEKNETIKLSSTYLENMKYELLRIDSSNVYLGISLDSILVDKNISLHEEVVIYGGNSYDNASAIYDDTETLYIAIYQNFSGPWDKIDPLKGNAILLDKSNTDTSSYTYKLSEINAILTDY